MTQEPLVMSRQTRYQRRHQALGLCWLCPAPVAYGGTRCARHLLRTRLAQRARTGSQPWAPGRRGRAPLEVRAGR